MGKQGQIPGTERPKIEELTNASEALRKLKAQRAGLTSDIADANAHMDALVVKNLKEGTIKLPDKPVIKKEPIYVYEDENGELQSIKWTVKTKGDVSGHDGGTSVDEGPEEGPIG